MEMTRGLARSLPLGVLLLLGTLGCEARTATIPSGDFVADSSRAVWIDGEPQVLIGHSVTQAALQNLNFDLDAWLDALERRGVRTAMVWSFMAVRQTADGEVVDDRYGYVVPQATPWKRAGSTTPGEASKPRWDLRTFDDEKYWSRLRTLLDETRSRGITLWITVFDGWLKGGREAEAFHPFRTENGGPLSRPSDFVVLHDYDAEIQGPFDPEWPWQKRNQWFQERFADRLAREVDGYEHVILELFNEGEWYDPPLLLRHHRHFLEFFRRRTDNLLAVNEDYLELSANGSPRSELEYDIASWHSHGYELKRTYARWLDGYRRRPVLPLVDSETVPAHTGLPGGPSVDEVRRLMWGILMAGGHVFVQDDASFAFDSRAPERRREELLEQLGHATDFFGQPGFDVADLRPCPGLSEPPYCLRSGSRIVVYAPTGDTVRLDLASGTEMRSTWFNPRSGEVSNEETHAASDNGVLVRDAPGPGDWVLSVEVAEAR